jgi:hypothetical protein
MKVKDLLKEAVYNPIGEGGMIVYLDPKTKKFYLERRNYTDSEMTLFSMKDYKKLKSVYSFGFDSIEFRKHFDSREKYAGKYSKRPHIRDIIHKMKTDVVKRTVEDRRKQNGE